MSAQSLSMQERITAIRSTLPQSVRLIAVSKYMPTELIRQAYDAGVRNFGESRVQEAVQKKAELQDLPDIVWHLIGHLQSNKAKLAVQHFDWIHSVDSLALAQRLDRIAAADQASPQLCLQVKIVPDSGKFGWSVAELKTDLPGLQACSNLKWRGLMTILPIGLTDQKALDVFHQTRKLAVELAAEMQGLLPVPELSMGMSNDYPLAVQSGATMIRLGRCIFGDRPQP